MSEVAYNKLIVALKKSSLLNSCSSLLSWDEHTYMPHAGTEHRAEQMSLLAGMLHEQLTSPIMGELLAEVEGTDLCADAISPSAVNIREARRKYDRATKLPRRLVEEMSRVTSLSQQVWITARKEKDFSQFCPWLEQVISLKREEAEAVGYGDGVPYDALLDEYEPGAKTTDIDAVFRPLREELSQLVAAIAASNVKPDVSIVTRNYPKAGQQMFSRIAAGQIGFDFTAGRLDETAHPFCSGIGPGDCRLTTRYDEHHFPGAFFGTLHEAGHGIYDQGLNRDAFGTAMGQSVSLGIHESQSRLWENFVGRSHSFWNHFFKPLQNTFSEALGGVTQDQFYAAINTVQPSFIRVEADEVTYNLHVMLRFELEQKMIAGEIEAADIPSAWNELFTQSFGITPPDDALGCMQDIHWSMGLLGYFPTYALGNMYAAQLFDQAKQDVGDLDTMFSRGEFAPLKKWLNKEVHQRGMQHWSSDLIEVITGEPLSHLPLVKHLKTKFSALYHI